MSNSKKKNFHKVPKGILQKVSKVKGPLIVAISKKITYSNIEKGSYKELGLLVENGKLKFSETVIPSNKGRFSIKNIHGWEEKRKDLPMIQQTRTFETPNFGDPHKGYHEVSITRDVYKVDFHPPRELSISIKLLQTIETGKDISYVFKISVDKVLDTKDDDFYDKLFFNINLLQENIGGIDVYSATSQDIDFLKQVVVDWEIIPIGERATNIGNIVLRYKTITDKQRKTIEDRHDLLIKLKPKSLIVGADGFRRYFGAQFSNNLVVFENIDYGNAIYVMYEEWERLSKLTRDNLLKNEIGKYDRIQHIGNWKKELKLLLADKLK